MHRFLLVNRAALVARCLQKVAQRPGRFATPEQLEHGVPLFLDQLARTLAAEEQGLDAESVRISGAAGGLAHSDSEIGVSAAAHGKELLDLGFTIDEVVHDYGDLCQAITDLALEVDANIPTYDFRTLNRCLDNAIAGAVTAFSRGREMNLVSMEHAEANERLGVLVHELRNALQGARLAISALESGHLPITGATGAVLKRSMQTLTILIDRSFAEVKLESAVLHASFEVDLLSAKPRASPGWRRLQPVVP